MKELLMKIIIASTLGILLTLTMTGCSKSIDWDNDVRKLEDAGYIVTNHTSEEELSSITHEFNSWAKFKGYDLTFNVVRCTSLLKDENYDNQVTYYQFSTENEASNYYNFEIETRMEGSVNKYYYCKDIVIFSDNNESMDILGYDFK